jgi:hypothetical protein
MYQNRTTLIGFLGKDAEVKTIRNNGWFTVLSLAIKRSWGTVSPGRDPSSRRTAPACWRELLNRREPSSGHRDLH